MTNTVRNVQRCLEAVVGCADRYQSALSKQLAAHDLTISESDILIVLHNHRSKPHLSLTQIAERVGVQTPPSRLVKSLRQRGLVAETRDTTDQRVWRFALTAKGRKLAVDVSKIKTRLASRAKATLKRPSATSIAKALTNIEWKN